MHRLTQAETGAVLAVNTVKGFSTIAGCWIRLAQQERGIAAKLGPFGPWNMSWQGDRKPSTGRSG